MGRKYDEAMEHIELTREMRERILDNVEKALLEEKEKAKVIRFRRVKRAAAMAACLCLVIVGGLMVRRPWETPGSEVVLCPTPILEMTSQAQMEEYLDFQVPVLEKAVAGYLVYVSQETSAMACVNYEDGSQFRMEQGTGDISGIHGGSLTGEKTVDAVTVSYYTYQDLDGTVSYALWEHRGFTCSYVFPEEIPGEIETLIGAIS